MIEPIHVPTFGDPDQWLDGKGRLVRADGSPVISDQEREAFAEKFREGARLNRLIILPESTPLKLDFTKLRESLEGHPGRCGPRWRPMRAWFGLTAYKFKGCRFDWGIAGFCERRYVWDRGAWRPLLSDRQLERLEREVML